jgi:hypothetical protein
MQIYSYKALFRRLSTSIREKCLIVAKTVLTQARSEAARRHRRANRKWLILIDIILGADR